MPYEGEFASYQPIQRIVNNARVQKLLEGYRIRQRSDDESLQEQLVPAQLAPSNWLPQWVLAVDGSNMPVEIENGFPGAEAGYVTVAAVLLNMARMREMDQTRPANPHEFQKLQDAQSIDWLLPGCNVIAEEETDAKPSFRRSLFDLFAAMQMSEDGETLLDTYEALLVLKPKNEKINVQRCPYDDCPAGLPYVPQCGQYTCACEKKRSLYSTDALRLHERMNPYGSNERIYTEIMTVLERVWAVHFLRIMESKSWLPTVGIMLAILLDGQLAVFGQPAWISESIQKELVRINTLIREATGRDLLLIGIEKDGNFVQHLQALDANENTLQGNFPKQEAMLLTDNYIKQNIIYSKSDEPYGRRTYFGRKFFYKTRSGSLIVATLPFLADDHKDTTRAEPYQYPRLADAMGVLDQLFSSRYPNSLAPIVAAHAEAAIPLNMGKSILERLAKELIRERRPDQ
jgi:hypothetical protein